MAVSMAIPPAAHSTPSALRKGAHGGLASTGGTRRDCSSWSLREAGFSWRAREVALSLGSANLSTDVFVHDRLAVRGGEGRTGCFLRRRHDVLHPPGFFARYPKRFDRDDRSTLATFLQIRAWRSVLGFEHGNGRDRRCQRPGVRRSLRANSRENGARFIEAWGMVLGNLYSSRYPSVRNQEIDAVHGSRESMPTRICVMKGSFEC